jgi:serine/threonine protein phosphatase 1
MNERQIVIGDVHGSYNQLVRLLDSPHANDRHIVFVGDLIDRGPESNKVLDAAVELAAGWAQGVTLLRGNHEQSLLEFLKTGDASSFLKNGGLATVASYYDSVPPNVLTVFRREFPTSHLTFLQGSVMCIENDDVLISHMGYDPARPTMRDLDAMVLHAHQDLFRVPPPGPDKLTIFGHYAQSTRQPYLGPRLVCLDTGCGTFPGAPLTAMLLPEKEIVQVDSEGDVK